MFFKNHKLIFEKLNIFGVWFTDQSSEQPAIKEKRDIILVEISNICKRICFFLARIQEKMLVNLKCANIVANTTKILLDHAKQSVTDTLKTASKRAIQKQLQKQLII